MNSNWIKAYHSEKGNHKSSLNQIDQHELIQFN